MQHYSQDVIVEERYLQLMSRSTASSSWIFSRKNAILNISLRGRGPGRYGAKNSFLIVLKTYDIVKHTDGSLSLRRLICLFSKGSGTWSLRIMFLESSRWRFIIGKWPSLTSTGRKGYMYILILSGTCLP